MMASLQARLAGYAIPGNQVSKGRLDRCTSHSLLRKLLATTRVLHVLHSCSSPARRQPHSLRPRYERALRACMNKAMICFSSVSALGLHMWLLQDDGRPVYAYLLEHWDKTVQAIIKIQVWLGASMRLERLLQEA